MTELQEQAKVSTEALHDRIPVTLSLVLRDLWRKHFNIAEGANRYIFGDHGMYESYWGQFGLTLEHLARTRKITPDPRVFDDKARIRRDASVEDFRSTLLEKQQLTGVSVFVLGGIEGRVFAEMGADVTSIDLLKFPSVHLPNLNEIQGNFTEEFALKNKGCFDLTFSSGVFDPGSGLKDSEQAFKLVLDMTKDGGISVHNGTSVPWLARDSGCRIAEVAGVYKSDLSAKPYSTPRSTVYVLEK